MYFRMDAILLGMHIGLFFSVYLYSNVINIFIFQVSFTYMPPHSGLTSVLRGMSSVYFGVEYVISVRGLRHGIVPRFMPVHPYLMGYTQQQNIWHVGKRLTIESPV
jgi:hypothetical protein